MSKKKIGLVALSLAAIATIGVGSTLAYFTDNGSTNNVITMGHVDVELTEPNFDTEDGTADNAIDNVTPNQTIVKDPTITIQDGSEDCYVRATITIDGLDEEQVGQLLEGIDVDKTVWYFNEEDSYYYYNAKLSIKDEDETNDSAVLFNTVKIPERWGNDFVGATITIDVVAEAIQADNFTPVESEGMITAWTYSDGSAITAETYVPAPQ